MANNPNRFSKYFDRLQDAQMYYNEAKVIHKYVCLLYSHHEYSEGYWVEFAKPTNLFGTIINIHDIADIRDDKIKEILNEKEKNINI